MIAKKLLFLLLVIGLITGCSTRTSPQQDAEPSPIPSPIPSPRPTQTPPLETETVPVNEATEILGEQPPSIVPPPAEHRPPPSRDDPEPHTLAEMARFDLADRLYTDVDSVQVMGVVTRELDADVMSCIEDEPLFEKLWEDDQGERQVEWISLSVKGNVHHYIVLGDWVAYCGQ
ncbi:MAG: hypothetical protein GY832_27285 [Chloroflexi bacterium]|nr:hypothetical protein [Chloroflexota bacterium]